MRKISNRAEAFTDSVIRRMTRISDEYGAINLSQGFPDFDPPKEILDALSKVVYEGPFGVSVDYLLGVSNIKTYMELNTGAGKQSAIGLIYREKFDRLSLESQRVVGQVIDRLDEMEKKL